VPSLTPPDLVEPWAVNLRLTIATSLEETWSHVSGESNPARILASSRSSLTRSRSASSTAICLFLELMSWSRSATRPASAIVSPVGLYSPSWRQRPAEGIRILLESLCLVPRSASLATAAGGACATSGPSLGSSSGPPSSPRDSRTGIGVASGLVDKLLHTCTDSPPLEGSAGTFSSPLDVRCRVSKTPPTHPTVTPKSKCITRITAGDLLAWVGLLDLAIPTPVGDSDDPFRADLHEPVGEVPAPECLRNRNRNRAQPNDNYVSVPVDSDGAPSGFHFYTEPPGRRALCVNAWGQVTCSVLRCL